MKPRYLIRPKADQDLDEHACYLAREGSPEFGPRFLVAAHETFALLATQPGIGWHFRSKRPELHALRVFRVSGFERILVLYFHNHPELRFFESFTGPGISRESCGVNCLSSRDSPRSLYPTRYPVHFPALPLSPLLVIISMLWLCYGTTRGEVLSCPLALPHDIFLEDL